MRRCIEVCVRLLTRHTVLSDLSIMKVMIELCHESTMHLRTAVVVMQCLSTPESLQHVDMLGILAFSVAPLTSAALSDLTKAPPV